MPDSFNMLLVLCYLRFPWYLCPNFPQPFHFGDESAQHREFLEEGRDLVQHQQESFTADGHWMAVSVNSNHSVHLARPSWKRLAINFHMLVEVRSIQSWGHFRRTGTKCCWPFTFPLTACEGVFKTASLDTHSGRILNWGEAKLNLFPYCSGLIILSRIMVPQVPDRK